MYGEGISREGELLDLAVKAEVVQKQEHGSAMTADDSDRDVTRSRNFSKPTRNLLLKLRRNSGKILTSFMNAKSLLQR